MHVCDFELAYSKIVTNRETNYKTPRSFTNGISNV